MINAKHQETGRIGGITTLMRYGKSYFSDIGKMGGRPKSTQLGQQQAPTDKIELKGGMVNNRFLASQNNIKVLKELWRQSREGHLAASSSSQEVI